MKFIYYALYYDHCISVCFDILYNEKVAEINWIELNDDDEDDDDDDDDWEEEEEEEDVNNYDDDDKDDKDDHDIHVAASR